MAQVIDPISKLEIVDGILITDIEVTTTGTIVPHRLKRQPLGWILADKTAVGDIYRTAWDSYTITLQSSANTTISMWVF